MRKRVIESAVVNANGDDAKMGDLVKAEMGLSPEIANAPLVRGFNNLGSWGAENLNDGAITTALEALSARVSEGDMTEIEAVLVSQIFALNSIFAHSAALSGNAKGLNAAQRSQFLMQIALKAQGNCRATVEALVALKFPRTTVFAKQANVAAGGHQQINNNGVSAPVADALPAARLDVPLLPDASVSLSQMAGQIPRAHARKPKAKQKR